MEDRWREFIGERKQILVHCEGDLIVTPSIKFWMYSKTMFTRLLRSTMYFYMEPKPGIRLGIISSKSRGTPAIMGVYGDIIVEFWWRRAYRHLHTRWFRDCGGKVIFHEKSIEEDVFRNRDPLLTSIFSGDLKRVLENEHFSELGFEVFDPDIPSEAAISAAEALL
ncbi:MAG: hypothetical protein D6698_08710 [Gammaproteobacteria bacterium]|nr:MAG: hypothetical protein D6698_08710 [Gammaproteobacteria bacterium]